MPKRWIALPLALLLAPIGFLYLGRPMAALIYFLVGSSIQTAHYFLWAEGALRHLLLFAMLALMVIAVIHAHLIIRVWAPVNKRPWFSTWIGLVSLVGAYVTLTVTLRAFFVEPFSVPSSSMHPSIPIKSYMLVEKWGYGHYGTHGMQFLSRPVSSSLRRGDVIVFDYPLAPERQFVKRLVGLPGDKVSYLDKRLSINGKEVLTVAAGLITELIPENGSTTQFAAWEESMEAGTHKVQTRADRPPLMGPIRSFTGRERCEYEDRGFTCSIPDGHYFVLGDNRDNADDGRYWGFVPERMIVGKVLKVFQPSAWLR